VFEKQEKLATMESASLSSEGKPAQIPQAEDTNTNQSSCPQQTEVKDAEPEPPFSIYSSREKKFIVLMASLAALLSPLSANIYYPALNVLADELSVSLTLINLTITAYLVRKSP
jgi:hypothetical protein